MAYTNAIEALYELLINLGITSILVFAVIAFYKKYL